MEILKLAENAKTKFHPGHKNTFGLTFGTPEMGGTCPGATQGEGGCLNTRNGCTRPTCYMAKIVQIYKGVGPTLSHNDKLLVGHTEDEMFQVLSETVKAFVAKHTNPKDWFMRLHYSGDCFSDTYARALVRMCQAHPNVQFWIYTRSFGPKLKLNCVEILSEAPNMAVFISCDPVNKIDALAEYEKHSSKSNVALAWLGDTDDTSVRYVACPETGGKIKNTTKAGACSRCRRCFTYSPKLKLLNVKFKIH